MLLTYCLGLGDFEKGKNKNGRKFLELVVKRGDFWTFVCLWAEYSVFLLQKSIEMKRPPRYRNGTVLECFPQKERHTKGGKLYNMCVYDLFFMNWLAFVMLS